MPTPIPCSRCGDLCEEATDGLDTLCGRCDTEENYFPCAWCAEYGDVADQHAYVAVFAPWEAGVENAGLYQVIQTPYSWQGLIGGGRLRPAALTWLGFLPADVSDDAFPCGHLCCSCQQRALALIAAHHTACAMFAATQT